MLVGICRAAACALGTAAKSLCPRSLPAGTGTSTETRLLAVGDSQGGEEPIDSVVGIKLSTKGLRIILWHSSLL